MKIFRIISQLFVIATLAVLLTNCSKDEKDIPPIASIDPDSIVTIGDLRAMIAPGQTYSFRNSGKQLFAVITMDQGNGNIFRQAYIQDHTDAVNLRMAVNNTDLKMGDSIRLALNGATISYFNNMFQLDSVDGNKNIVKQAAGKYLEPVTVTINDIKSGGYQARLVRIENVQFTNSELGETWADGINRFNVNRTLQDCENNTIIVRTSGYADFADDILPEGNGSFIGVVGQFGDTWQLYVRDPEELTMTNERCVIDTGETGTGTLEDPFNVAYAINNNSGSGVWVEGYIVGVMETYTSVFHESFEGPFQTESNLLLADSPDETDPNNVLYVQLPFGSSPRQALNLAQNPGRHGTHAKIKGNLAAYFSSPGLRDASDYRAEDINGDDPDPDPDADPVTSIDENFQSYANYDIINHNNWISFREAGERDWICRTFQNNHYAQATAHNSTDAQNIMWMITPAVDLDAIANPVLEFESAKSFYTHDGFSLHISVDFNASNPGAATWQTLDATLAGQSHSDNDWIHSGVIDLSAYSGIVRIAWKYEAIASQGQTGTFRVDNVRLYNQQ